MSNRLKILFVSRAYPPIVGGIENQNAELAAALSGIADVSIVANTRGKAFLPVFFVTALFRSLWRVRSADVVLLGDGVLGLWGVLLKALSGKPVCAVLHGLDITYGSRLYQALWVRFALNRLNALFAVGNATIDAAVQRGVSREYCHFIPNGVSPVAPPSRSGQNVSLDSRNGRIVRLFTLGRLVERKGVAWFIAEVLPKLPGHVHYWIAGDGPHRSLVEQLVTERGLGERVSVLGAVSNEDKTRLLSEADIFVQPNIPVPGDIEGFGLVVLEAAAAGLPVVAARLEGLKDAIVDGKSGFLVEPGNADAFAERIGRLAADSSAAREFGAGARRFVEEHCLWPRIAARYVEALSSLVRADQ